MARSAATLAVIERLPSCGIPDFERRSRPVEAGADEGNQAVQFRRLKPERRHAGGGYAIGDGVADVVIARRAAELVAREIDAIDAVAVLAVADGALRAIEPFAGVNVLCAVLAILQLCPSRQSQRGACKRGHSDESTRATPSAHTALPPGRTGATSPNRIAACPCRPCER